MTYVTCPIMRYHPAVVAQQAATVALLAGDGRFTLGLGAGENLNEHVVGQGWPPANVRHEMFAEALQSRINALTTDVVNRDDPYQRAKLADDRQKALAELQRVTGEIEQAKKDIADIEEEARKAGVPPGWLR